MNQSEETEKYNKLMSFSGCDIDIHNNKFYKTSNDRFNPFKLKQQAVKQQKYHLNYQHNKIIVPKVDIIDDNDNCTIVMDYFDSITLHDYICQFDTKDCIELINILFEFIDNNTLTITEQIDCHEIINELKNRTGQQYILPYDKPLTLHSGCSHGDLTFSNVLVHNDKIVLVDFLTWKIDLPIIDIIKLRQDSKHYWSLFITNSNITNYHKYDKIDKLIYKKYHNIIESYEYKILEIILLWRILPYCRHKHHYNFINDRIISCLNQF